MSWNIVLEHLFIVLVSGIFSILIGLPLGVLSYLYPKARAVILHSVDILQTIPALALLGIIMVFAGAGKVTVIIGITLYSLLPIVRNTCLGLEEVDTGVKEAALGIGMSRTHRLFQVEIPLAFPTIFTGIRIAVVNAIGTAVFAAFVGGGGIGSILNLGIRLQNMKLVLGGTAALMVIAVVLDLLMGVIESRTRKKHGGMKKIVFFGATLLAVLCLILTFQLKGTDSSNELVLYDGDYSETQIMHHMVKFLVEDKTDLSVTIKDQMSQVNNFKALIGDNNSCDLMISYDGTLLTTFLHLDTTDIPEGTTLYDFVNETARKEFGVHLLGKLNFNNTYAIAVPKSIAETFRLEKISDLVPVANQLVFGAEHEFFTQEGSMKYGPFTSFYGLSFKDSISVDVSLKYAAIESGSFDVTEVYATDGLNRKAGLKILEDDRSFFPHYNGALLVRDDTFEKFADIAPNLEEVLSMLEGQISSEDMVEMTYRVDVLGETVDAVALEFLQSRGLISSQSLS